MKGEGLPRSSCQCDTGAMCPRWHMILGIKQRHAAGLKPGNVHSVPRSGPGYWQIIHQLLNLIYCEELAKPPYVHFPYM